MGLFRPLGFRGWFAVTVAVYLFFIASLLWWDVNSSAIAFRTEQLLYLGFTVQASLASFLLLTIDKWKVAHGGRPISETTLHVLELCGGWAGSLVAQELFQHKTDRSPYRARFTAIALGHVALSLVLIWHWLGI